MPVLPIVEEDGSLSPIAPLIVLTTSVFPDDEKYRSFLLGSLLVRHLEQQPDADFSGLAPLIPMLHKAPSPRELDRRMKEEIERSHLANATLTMMLSASIHHPECRVSPMIVLACFPRIVRSFSAERTRWRLWAKFRSVSPLLVAKDLLFEIYPRPQKKDGVARFIFDTFPEYLDIAESVRMLAEERRFLAFDEAWRAPDSVAITRRPLPIGPLTDAALEAIKTYVPEHSKVLPP